MIKLVLLGLGLAIAGVLVAAATKPDACSVQRTATIAAPPEAIFPLINDLRAWGPWSPYEKRDPAMKRAYSRNAIGRGATYEWAGNFKIGAGRIEITESVPPSRVALRLDMIKPMEGHNVVVFTLRPHDGVTDVTWAMTGHEAFVAKVMSVFFNMDRMIGGEFETGLASLKAVTEGRIASARPAAAPAA